jgi:SAM-dependent methyltransferase
MKFGLKDYFLMYKKYGIRLPISYFFQTHIFDLINGTDTHVWLPKENFIDKPKNFDNGVLYMSSWTNTIKESTLKVFEIFSLNVSDVAFVDIGCGKGKVLSVWNRMFLDAKRIVGIDYSPYLLGICESNLQKISASEIELICGDATDLNLNFGCSVNILYLYNPFDAEILSKFVQNIHKKNTIVIYNNPLHKDIFFANGFSQFYEENSWHPNADFSILSNMNHT